MKGDLRLFYLTALLGLSAAHLSGCFWPCSDCGDCESPPDAAQAASVERVEKSEFVALPEDAPEELAGLATAVLRYPAEPGFTLHYTVNGRPVVLRFGMPTQGTAGAGGAYPEAAGGLGGQAIR